MRITKNPDETYNLSGISQLEFVLIGLALNHLANSEAKYKTVTQLEEKLFDAYCLFHPDKKLRAEAAFTKHENTQKS